jgi:carbonic anhydrase/acetyltransferase-like protein (isoleucine patch superfamily)
MKKGFHLLGKAFRETGQAMDRLGLTVAENEIYKETFSRHRPVMNLFEQRPIIAAGVFVAPNASVIGRATLMNDVSVWYGAVVRADKHRIKIGSGTNVQDRAVINTVTSLDNGFPADVFIGERVTIGHGALLTSCTIGPRVLIGQGAIVQAGADIGADSMLAAGAVVLPNTVVPSKQLWAGNPAKYIRDLTDEELSMLDNSASEYVKLSKEHDAEFLPYGTVYQAAEKQDLI